MSEREQVIEKAGKVWDQWLEDKQLDPFTKSVSEVLVDFAQAYHAEQTSAEVERLRVIPDAFQRYTSSLDGNFYEPCRFAEDLPELCRTHNYNKPCPVWVLRSLEADES